MLSKHQLVHNLGCSDRAPVHYSAFGVRLSVTGGDAPEAKSHARPRLLLTGCLPEKSGRGVMFP